LNPFQKYFNLTHNSFLPYPSAFIIHRSSHDSTKLQLYVYIYIYIYIHIHIHIHTRTQYYVIPCYQGLR
jgi:hypothetical protein